MLVEPGLEVRPDPRWPPIVTQTHPRSPHWPLGDPWALLGTTLAGAVLAVGLEEPRELLGHGWQQLGTDRGNDPLGHRGGDRLRDLPFESIERVPGDGGVDRVEGFALAWPGCGVLAKGLGEVHNHGAA